MGLGSLDVLAVGETMLSMVAIDGPLGEATTFRATLGGAESNACVALARLGSSAAWVSRLGEDPAGDRILAALDGEGVQLSWVTRDPDRPTGLMLRDAVGDVRYYRAGSAASALSAEDLADVPVEDARAVFTTGITAMLGRGPRRAAGELFRRAEGLRVVDVNLRRGLWGSHRAVELIGPLLGMSHLALGGHQELGVFAPGLEGEALARSIADRGPREVVVKRGRLGAAALDRDGTWHELTSVPGPDVDPVGAGDAFDGGYLHARLAGAHVPEALEEGGRCGAAVAATIGDSEGVPRVPGPQK
jgi:2-dehydro-3-deoxygluconokinase